MACKCKACGGTGKSSKGASCGPCNGTGKLRPNLTGLESWEIANLKSLKEKIHPNAGHDKRRKPIKPWNKGRRYETKGISHREKKKALGSYPTKRGKVK